MDTLCIITESITKHVHESGSPVFGTTEDYDVRVGVSAVLLDVEDEGRGLANLPPSNHVLVSVLFYKRFLVVCWFNLQHGRSRSMGTQARFLLGTVPHSSGTRTV